MMKKIFVLMILLISQFCLCYANEEDNHEGIKQFIDKLIRMNFDYVCSQKENEILNESNKENIYQWMPKFSMSFSPSYSYLGYEEEKFQNDYSSTMSLLFSQKIPLGIYSEGVLSSYSNYLENDQIKNDYQFIGNINMYIPVFAYFAGLSKDIIINEKLKRNMINDIVSLNSVVNYLDTKSKIINSIGNYLYILECERLLIEKINIYKKYFQDIQLMYEQKQISFYEKETINDQIRKLQTEYNDLVINKFELISDFKLYNIEINEINFNLEQWIEYCEKTFSKKIETNYQIDIEALSMQIEWLDNVQDIIEDMPTLCVSTNVNPNVKKNNYDKFLSTFNSYWASTQTWNCECSISVNIPLFDYNENYLKKRIIKLQRENYKIKLRELSNKKEFEINKNKELISITYEIFQNTNDLYNIEMEKQNDYKKLYEMGNVNYYDYQFSLIECKQLLLDSQRKYLDYIEAYVNSY